MHYLYFVKVSKDEAKTARQAISRAGTILNNNNFVDDGYWGNGKCDWYVIGGRWSGVFLGIGITKDFSDEVKRLIRSKEPNREEAALVTDADTTRYADLIQSLWLSLGGTGTNPYARDTQLFGGCDDDATVITADLIARLKRKWPDDVEYFDNTAHEEKSLSALSDVDIGHWLIAVDYHF